MFDENVSRKDRMFQRLASLVKGRFDAVITFTDIGARLRIADVKTLTTVQRNPTAPILIAGKDVVFPLRFDSHLFGYITLFNGVAMGESTIDQIKSLIDVLMLETCILEDKNQRVKILEHYLSKEISVEDVIELKDRLNSEDINQIPPEISLNREALDQVFPILVESHREEDGREFALEISKSSERAGFITYEPYLLSELSSVEALKSMGPVTLYIPNIRELPLDVQMTLSDFLNSSERTTLHPRIVVGLQESPEDLLMAGLFDHALFAKLSAARIKLPPKGTSSMTVEEILQFFDEAGPATATRSRHLYLVSPTESPH